jgi:short-subunit dehydrogenase
VMDSATVAREGYAAMNAGKVLVVNGWRNRLMTSLVGLSPRASVRKAVRKLQGE